MAAYDPETLSVGVLGRPHGVRGDLHFRPHNPSSRAFDDVRQLWLVRDGRSQRYDVAVMRPVADGYLTAPGRRRRSRRRRGADACPRCGSRARRCRRSRPGEYFVEDVVGCAVEGEDGRPLGVVRGTLWNGAHDVATVDGADGRERMIPLVPEFVLNVDAPARKMRVRWHGDDDDDA